MDETDQALARCKQVSFLRMDTFLIFTEGPVVQLYWYIL